MTQCRPTDVGDSGFSASDGLVDDHTSKHESRACGMMLDRAISDINVWLAVMQAKYAGSANLRRDANLCRQV